jgi:ribulose-phosphate 3-epimerase
MSVNPGFAGQKFMAEVLTKIRKLSVESRKLKVGFEIEVDGGINDKTAPLALEAGADILATASYFFGAKDKIQAVKALKEGR